MTKSESIQWKWQVTSETSGRADRAILNALENHLGTWSNESPEVPSKISRNQIQKLIQTGHITVNGEAVVPSRILLEYDRVEMSVPPPRDLDLTPDTRPLEILFEDEHLAIVNKPKGVSVHPSETEQGPTLVNILLHHVRNLSGIGGVLRPGIVHRLDKLTSGALVVTKTDLAHQGMSELFSRHAIERKYWALCYRSLKSDQEVRLESTLGRNPRDRKKIAMNVKDGRIAISHFRTLEKYSVSNRHPFASWVEARLETGRTHQVRVHLTHLDVSIIGDPIYGVPSDRQYKWTELPPDIQAGARQLTGQALHARSIAFQHPITGLKVQAEAPPPDEFLLLHSLLKRYSN